MMKIHFQFFKIQDDMIFVASITKKNRSFFFSQSTDALHFNLDDQLATNQRCSQSKYCFPFPN